MVKIIMPMMDWLIFTWDARTRQNGRRTRVRRGDARGTPLPAHQTASSVFFRFQIHADSRRFGSDARWFAPNRIVSAEYRCVSAGKRKSAGKEKKKKKLKPKIPVDWILIRHCRRWTEIVSLLLRVLYCIVCFSLSPVDWVVLCFCFFFVFVLGSVLQLPFFLLRSTTLFFDCCASLTNC